MEPEEFKVGTKFIQGEAMDYAFPLGKGRVQEIVSLKGNLAKKDDSELDEFSILSIYARTCVLFSQPEKNENHEISTIKS